MAVLVLAGLAMLLWSWGTWPDVLIDFGRELYVPWQLTQGKTLYRDLAHFNGPFSQYLNALWFRLFGVGLATLVWCNLAILTGFVWLVYRLLFRMGDRLSTTVGCLVFLTVFAFGQLVVIGNYNFLCPYSHELTHGVILSVGAMGCLSSYLCTRRLRAIAAAGVCLGLVFLTKAEVFLAALLAMTVGLGLTLWAERPSRARRLLFLGTGVGGLLVPPVIAYLLLRLCLPAREALEGTLGTWPWIFRGEAFDLVFYQRWSGVLDLGMSLRTMLAWSGWYAALLIPTALVALALRTPGRWRTVLSTAWAGLVGGWLLWCARLPWAFTEIGRPFPLALGLIGVASLVALARRPRQLEAQASLITRLTFITFSLALLLKIVLYARVWNYGFVVGMPAALVLTVALLCWIPAWIASRGGYGGAFRTTALIILALLVVSHLDSMAFYVDRKVVPVGRGADRFMAGLRGVFVNQALDDLLGRTRPSDTVAVLPQGVMLNYLARRVNPTPYFIFDPLVLTSYGEDRILASFQTAPPDYIVLTHIDSSEHGTRFFGRDFGHSLSVWLRAHYREVHLIGAPPLTDDRFGILILQRLEARRGVARTRG